MQVILKGSLRHFPPAALLRFLAASGQGGTLDLVSVDGPRVRLFVRDGCVVCGQAAEPADAAGCVCEALGFSDGAFALVDEVVLPDGASVESLTIDAVLEAAVERAARAKTFPDSTIFRVIENPSDQISMTSDEFKVVLRVGGTGKSFGELAQGRSGEELAALLRAMEERGLIRHEDAPAAAPVPPIAEPVGDATTLSGMPFVRKTTQAPPPPPPPPPVAPPPPPVTPPPPGEAPTQIYEPPAVKARAASLTGDGGEAFALFDDGYTVGRDGTSDITISDSSISTRHARFVRDGESYAVEDLGSRNGTFVNGEAVTGSRRTLTDNDVIRFGRVIFTFNLANEIRPGETTERKMTRRTRQ